MTEINPQAGSQGNGQQAGDYAARNATEALRQGTQAFRHNVRIANEVVSRAGNATAEVTQRSSEVGAEAVKRAGNVASETLLRGGEAFAKTQREFMRSTGEQFEQASRKVAQAAQATTKDLRVFLTLPGAATGGMRDMQQSMAGFVEGIVRTNFQATQEMFQFVDPSALVELQQRFMRGYLDTLMHSAATLVRAMRTTADEALGNCSPR